MTEHRKALAKLIHMPEHKNPTRGAAWGEYQNLSAMRGRLVDALEKAL